MKKNLTIEKNELWHIVEEKKILGMNKLMIGNCSGLRGDCSGLKGNCTGLRGNLDLCEITDSDRKEGVEITDLIDK